MTGLNFQDMADPEKLRSAIRAQFPGLKDADVDQLVGNDELKLMMDLTDRVYKWHKEFVAIRKDERKSDDPEAIITALFKVVSAYLVGYVDFKDPIVMVKGTRGINALFADVWAKAIVATAMSKFKR